MHAANALANGLSVGCTVTIDLPLVPV
ncbi:hypothetical protein [Sphingomonas aurantiaca]